MVDGLWFGLVLQPKSQDALQSQGWSDILYLYFKIKCEIISPTTKPGWSSKQIYLTLLHIYNRIVKEKYLKFCTETHHSQDNLIRALWSSSTSNFEENELCHFVSGTYLNRFGLSSLQTLLNDFFGLKRKKMNRAFKLPWGNFFAELFYLRHSGEFSTINSLFKAMTQHPN